MGVITYSKCLDCSTLKKKRLEMQWRLLAIRLQSQLKRQVRCWMFQCFINCPRLVELQPSKSLSIKSDGRSQLHQSNLDLPIEISSNVAVSEATVFTPFL